MKIFPGFISEKNRLMNFQQVKNDRIKRKKERRSNEGPILPFVEKIFEDAGITGSPTEKFCEIQYMIGQTLKENVIPQIQAGGPVGPFTVTVDGETAFSYPKADDFQFTVPGVTGLSFNSETISILNPNSTWDSMSFSIENGSTTPFAATITNAEDTVVDVISSFPGTCSNAWTEYQNLVLTDLIVNGLNTVDISSLSNTCENVQEGVSGYFTDETKTEVVFQLFYEFMLSLDLSMTAKMTTTGNSDSYLDVYTGYCVFDCSSQDLSAPCEDSQRNDCTLDSVSVTVKGENGDNTFLIEAPFIVTTNVTFRKDSITIDNMAATIELTPMFDVEAYLSETGSCDIIVNFPPPSETSTNEMLSIGIVNAITAVVNSFNGWLENQTFTIPL